MWYNGGSPLSVLLVEPKFEEKFEKMRQAKLGKIF
jgi:hypothetical protein